MDNPVNTQWGIAIGDGLKNGGENFINVEKAGKYKIELSRWPFHLNRNINDKGPQFSIGGNNIRSGSSHEIEFGCLSIENKETIIKKSIENSSSISIETYLDKGEAKLRAWFMDKNKNNICGAYYIRITNVSKE